MARPRGSSGALALLLLSMAATAAASRCVAAQLGRCWCPTCQPWHGRGLFPNHLGLRAAGLCSQAPGEPLKLGSSNWQDPQCRGLLAAGPPMLAAGRCSGLHMPARTYGGSLPVPSSSPHQAGGCTSVIYVMPLKLLLS